jgi:DNA-binding transcriptional MerR regulator
MAEGDAWLTRMELAGRLGVSEGTIRNWRAAFGDLIPSRVGRDRIRRYPLRLFEVVAVMRDRNLPTEEIRRALAEDGDAVPTVEDSGARIAAAMEDLTVVLRELITEVRRIADAFAPKDG